MGSSLIQKWMQLIVLFLTFAIWATTAQAATRCYKLERANSPEMSSFARPRIEIWCYQSLDYPQGHSFIFNFDDGEIHPETALLLSPDGWITHASRVAGELSLHHLRSKNYNPLSVPLREPTHLRALNDFELRKMTPTFSRTLEFFLKPRIEKIGTFEEASFLQVGSSSASVPSDHLPWRGYWWPYSGSPLFGSNQSPLAKYDQFVQAHSGTNPGARNWESRYHHYHGIGWEGHCNGWAASAILRAEPSHTTRDPISGVSFTVSDQKGILSERDYCASTAFFGNRYNGKANDDINDIYAPLFHKTITYYIGQLGKPVAFDYKRDASVDNHIISGYTMRTVPIDSNHFDVTTTLTVHGYDFSPSNQPGTAHTYKKTYHYILTTDASGNISGGRWLSLNPDFLWVPLDSPKCDSQNQRIDESWTQQILNLPGA